MLALAVLVDANCVPRDVDHANILKRDPACAARLVAFELDVASIRCPVRSAFNVFRAKSELHTHNRTMRRIVRV